MALLALAGTQSQSSWDLVVSNLFVSFLQDGWGDVSAGHKSWGQEGPHMLTGHL